MLDCEVEHTSIHIQKLTEMDISSARSGAGTGRGGGMKTMFQLTIPMNDMPPAFTDQHTNQNYDLIQSTAHCRDGKQRVPTPDRMAVLQLAASQDKHRLRRQQQLLLDIAQRCKEQDIGSMSSGITKKCSLENFGDKHIKDMREFSTNTILFKTWGMGRDDMMADLRPLREDLIEREAVSPRLQDRGNSYFPKRKVIRLAPKQPGMKSIPPLQLGYSKGLMVRPPDCDKKKVLKEELKINGPIQLGLYEPKNDQLQPLILPSIRYVGVEKDNIQTYVNSKQMAIALGPRGKSMHGTFAPLTAPDKKDGKHPRPSPELKMVGSGARGMQDSVKEKMAIGENEHTEHAVTIPSSHDAQ